MPVGKPSELICLAFVHGSCTFIVSRYDRRASLQVSRTRRRFQVARRKVAIVSRDVISRMLSYENSRRCRGMRLCERDSIAMVRRGGGGGGRDRQTLCGGSEIRPGARTMAFFHYKLSDAFCARRLFNAEIQRGIFFAYPFFPSVFYVRRK